MPRRKSGKFNLRVRYPVHHIVGQKAEQRIPRPVGAAEISLVAYSMIDDDDCLVAYSMIVMTA
jgi:hypothetical protein